jgi:hypothetical protein
VCGRIHVRGGRSRSPNQGARRYAGTWCPCKPSLPQPNRPSSSSRPVPVPRSAARLVEKSASILGSRRKQVAARSESLPSIRLTNALPPVNARTAPMPRRRLRRHARHLGLGALRADRTRDASSEAIRAPWHRRAPCPQSDARCVLGHRLPGSAERALRRPIAILEDTILSQHGSGLKLLTETRIEHPDLAVAG